MSKTLGQLAQQFAYLNVPTGAIGEKLEYIELTRTEVLALVPEEKYQRDERAKKTNMAISTIPNFIE